VAFLAFAAVLLAALFILTGVLAIYFHLFAVVTVAAPFLAAFATLAWRKYRGAKEDHVAGPTFMQWLRVAAVMAGLSAALVLSALIHSMQTTFFQVALKGSFEASGFADTAFLISGMGQPVLAGLFWALVIAGAVEQCRRNAWLGWMLAGLFPLHLLALVLSHPDGAHSARTISRAMAPTSIIIGPSTGGGPFSPT
jgi:uncharacterized membrane protein